MCFTFEEIISEGLTLNEAVLSLYRISGCIPLENSIEDEAALNLKEIKKRNYSQLDIFRAIKKSTDKRKLSIRTNSFFTAAPYSREVMNKVINLLEQESKFNYQK